MSLSRNNKIWDVAGSLLGRLSKKRSSNDRKQKSTRLVIDQLEERQLLSLTVATTENLLVNTSWQDIRGNVAVDSNDAGDIVVAWTAADRLANPDYDANDPNSSMYLVDEKGEYVEDLNVYARYLTDEVQIVTIPEECVPGYENATQSGSFELLYNAYETQRFSIYSSNFAQGGDDSYATSNSLSCFYLGFYAEGELNWVLFKYDSELLPGDNAANLQEKIRAIPGGEYSEVVVNAYSETDFDVTFYGDSWAGYNLTDVKVSNNYYEDVTALIDKVSSINFDPADLKGCSDFQKLILKDLFGTNYVTTIQNMIKTTGRKSVVKTLQIARDSLTDKATSGVVTTVSEVQTVTNYNSKGQDVGIAVSSDPYKTAQNIQDAFNSVSNQAKLYAPITSGVEYNERTHRYAVVDYPTSANSSDKSYGSLQDVIPSIEVVVAPVEGTTNQFKVTFTGASGLVNQDSLIVSAATYSTKLNKSYVYNDVVVKNTKQTAENPSRYVYVGTGDYDVDTATITIKESSAVFRVNSVEKTDYVLDEDGDITTDRWGNLRINGTGRTNQSKPDVSMSSDGSFVVVWESENADPLQQYNATDIYARRFVTQGYVASQGEGGFDPRYEISFYDNGTSNGYLGYQPPETAYDKTFVSDVYALNANSNVKVQGVVPVAQEFVVNASLNGKQIDPTIASDLDGNFIVAWTYLAQDNSYFGGVYGRQFNNLAQPVTGDIVFDSAQVSTNYYGPAYAGMSDDGFAVVIWNYGDSLYQAALEPQSSVFILDKASVATGGVYGSSVAFDYNGRYTISYTSDDGEGGTTVFPTTNAYLTVYEITEVELEEGDEEGNAFASSATSAGTNNANDNANANANGDEEAGLYVGRRIASEKYESAEIVAATVINSVTSGDHGNPSVAMDADGDIFTVYEGLGIDVQQVSRGYWYVKETYASNYEMETADPKYLFIQLKWSDFEDNNLAYKGKAFDRGGKISYEDKNEDLIRYIQLALGWGYDAYGDFTSPEDGGVPIYSLHAYDTIDVDSYIKFYMTVAEKEGATYEQLTRLDAILEALVSPLRNNGSDIGFTFYGQTLYSPIVVDSSSTNSSSTDASSTDAASVITVDTGSVSGVVSSYRNGSNACFYLAFPAEYVASVNYSLLLGRTTDRDNDVKPGESWETFAFDATSYYDSDSGYLVDADGMALGLSDALNALEICNGDAYSFVVRAVDMDEYDFYKGTIGEIGVGVDEMPYTYKYTVDDVEYYGERTISDYLILQVTAQSSLHDTPLTVRWTTDSSVKLRDQAFDDMNYCNYIDGLYVERNGVIGNSQTNATIESSSNGDLVIAWTMQKAAETKTREDVYPSIGNSLDVQSTHIYLRSFKESTDNAGPIVTNVSLPNGTTLDEGQTVASAVKDVVVSFSENMLTVGDGSSSYNTIHAVDNVANWHVLRDGVIVANAIESIDFGINASRDLARKTVTEKGVAVADINDGILANGTNRWEAVVHFADGLELTDGNYTLVCTNMVQDIARNAIYSQGYSIDGSSAGYDGKDWMIDFSVVPLNESLAFEYSESFPYDSYIAVNEVHGEEVVGDPTTNPIKQAKDSGDKLAQVTRSSIQDETCDANTANAVASNSNGDYVVTWIETTEKVDENTGNTSVTKTVYARAYRSLYVVDSDNVRRQIISKEDAAQTLITVYETTCAYDAKGALISGEETATDPRQASVAMDDKGDFVVAWDMNTFGEGEDKSRDVYIAKYAFNGGQMAINGNATTPIRVNVETEEDQQNASVAMDSDGDIVVVWESFEQDGSGWGIYGRRFMTNGLSFGYSNTIQVISFIDPISIQGDYVKLSGTVNDEDFTTKDVPLSVEMKTNATRIKEALLDVTDKNGKNLFTEDDLEVVVSAAGSISIEFKGVYTATYVNLMEVDAWNVPSNGVKKKSFTANIELRQEGSTGAEFSVNQTTANNQRFASIGMEKDGSFVVSWTSWGQGLDSAIESNIYARKFASNHVVSNSTISVVEMTTTTDPVKVISTDNIEVHEVIGGTVYDSVCMITVGAEATNSTSSTNADANAEAMGTGSLLTTRMHVLTAAHVVCSEDGTVVDPTEEEVYCTFETASGKISIRVTDIAVHPSYAGDPSDNQVDLAVLTLENAAPTSLKGYELYTGSSEVGQTITYVGYGLYGEANDTEEEIGARLSGRKHYGNNVYELTGADFQNAGNPNTLIYDFDDGTYANDYLGNYYGIRNLGLGDAEAITAPGDSGSPSFINGQIAGVCSYGSDFDGDESFGPGNYQVDVRVSAYVDWIESVVLSGLGDEFLVNTDSDIYVEVATEDDDTGATDDEEEVLLTDYWQEGKQLWSSVSMDGEGNFVITWTGYNQDGNGDSLTGGSNNGLGGIYMRVFVSDPTTSALSASQVMQVNQYTAYDQIHSQVAMAENGNFVVVYESYQDPSNDEDSDEVDNFGVYARRFALTSETIVVTPESDDEAETTEKVYDIKEIGSEFRVSRSDYFQTGIDGDQLGGSVAVDANGDMVFAYTDTSSALEWANVESVVLTRSISLAKDASIPYVVRVNAAYGDVDSQKQVSLYANNVVFASGNGPTELIYSFSEYMFTAQMNADLKADNFGSDEYDGLYSYRDNRNLENKNTKSVIDLNDWTLMKDGANVTSAYIYDILYGYNASNKVEEYLRARGDNPNDYIYVSPRADSHTDSYELVIVFKKDLPDGSYVLTLADKVTDACGKNNLDGDYDDEAGGSFSVRWTIGAAKGTADENESYVPSSDAEAFIEGQGNAKPVVVSNSEGFVIVAEQQTLYPIDTSSSQTGGNTNGNNSSSSSTSTGYRVNGYYETVYISEDDLDEKSDVQPGWYRIESDIVMRSYNADGSPSSVEVRVNPYSVGNQMSPDIDMTEGGSYVIGWIGESAEALNGVCARFYPGGKAQTKQVQVAGSKSVRCWDVDVSINEDAGLVLITWLQGSNVDEIGSDGPESDETYGRFYDLNGNALSNAFCIVSADYKKSVKSFDVASMTVGNELKYVVVWQMYNPNNNATNTFEIYQKVITAYETNGVYRINSGEISRVNDTVLYGQYAPKIATVDETGEYYVVWVSDQTVKNGSDVYARKYDANGNSLSFMGKIGEACVNTYNKDVQGLPSVAANADGVVFAWESYDQEEYNYDAQLKKVRHDYGIVVRVFDNAGVPVYAGGEILDEDGYKIDCALGQPLAMHQGEYVINTITSRDQITPSVAMFDWEKESPISEYKIPKYVVAWASANPNCGKVIEDETEEGNGNTSSTSSTGGTSVVYDDAPGAVGPYVIYYKLVSTSSASKTNEEPTVTSMKAERYSVDVATATSNGFYRPVDGIVEIPTAADSVATVDASILSISGTDGDDVIVVTVDAYGAVASIVANGSEISVPSGTKAIYFVGGAGNDKVVYNTIGTEFAEIDADASKATIIGTSTFVASGVESVEVGALRALNISANLAGDVVNLAADASSATTAKGFKFAASGVAEIVAQGGGKATVVMTGTSGNDAFVASNSVAILSGAGFDFEANGFANVRVVASAGVDTATLTDLQSLIASDGSLLATTSKSSIVAVGLDNVFAKGTGTASAKIYGTRGADSVAINDQSAETKFATGAVLSTEGFVDVSFVGNGGEDAALLTVGSGANVFEGWASKATLTNGVVTRALSGFSKVAVYGNEGDDSTLSAKLYDSARDDAFAAFDDTATMDVDGENLYLIVGADQVTVKRSTAKGSDSLDVDETLDFLFSTENWDLD